ncbi:hypothetical protein ACWGQT_00065 [Streptomyces yangpuensis]
MGKNTTSETPAENVGSHTQKFSDAVRGGVAVDPTMPTPDEVGARAKRIYEQFRADDEFDIFKAATLQYSSDWACFDGTVVVEKWDLELDKEPLFREAVRAIALKCAVYALTGDERAAEIAIAGPVDEMMHAGLAQQQVLDRMSVRMDIQVIHQTDQENNDYRPGDYTAKCYYVAFGKEPNKRYWLDVETVEARKKELAALYRSIGIQDFGHRHSIVFADTVAA